VVQTHVGVEHGRTKQERTRNDQAVVREISQGRAMNRHSTTTAASTAAPAQGRKTFWLDRDKQPES
jgi:hypothetical protein